MSFIAVASRAISGRSRTERVPFTLAPTEIEATRARMRRREREPNPQAVRGERGKSQNQGPGYGQQKGNSGHHGFNGFAVGADEHGDRPGRCPRAASDQPVVFVVGLLDPPVGVRLARAEKLFRQQAALPRETGPLFDDRRRRSERFRPDRQDRRMAEIGWASFR